MTVPIDPERFLELLRPDRCPLCHILSDWGHEHMKSLLEESVTDPVSREALFRSKGFCRRHAWRAVDQGRGLGMAVIYGSLLEKGLKELPEKPGFLPGRKPTPCPLCGSEATRDKAAVGQFALAWGHSPELRSAFAERGILCLDHLERILCEKLEKEHRKTLCDSGKKALEALLKELNEFLKKQDYHRSSEALGPERDAWIRAVRMVTGERS